MRDALKELQRGCTERGFQLGEVRAAIERHVNDALTSTPPRFTVVAVSFTSRRFGLAVLPFYPGHVVLDDKGAPLRVMGRAPQKQSFYGEERLSLAMRLISRARKR